MAEGDVLSGKNSITVEPARMEKASTCCFPGRERVSSGLRQMPLFPQSPAESILALLLCLRSLQAYRTLARCNPLAPIFYVGKRNPLRRM